MKRRNRILGAFLALLFGAFPAAAADRLMAFYVPWDPTSLEDVKIHAARIDTLAAVWLSVAGPDHALRVTSDPGGRAAIAALTSHPRLLLTVQNFADGSWQGGNADALLADPVASAKLIDALAVQVHQADASGVVIDFERLSDRGVEGLVRFVRLARPKLGRVEVAVPVGDAGWDLAALASVANGLVLMTYDQHWTTGEPGPIAGIDWYGRMLAKLPTAIERRKLTAGIAGYAYDWPAEGVATTKSVAAARDLADGHGASVGRDEPSGNDHRVRGEDPDEAGKRQIRVPARGCGARLRRSKMCVSLWSAPINASGSASGWPVRTGAASRRGSTGRRMLRGTSRQMRMP